MQSRYTRKDSYEGKTVTYIESGDGRIGVGSVHTHVSVDDMTGNLSDHLTSLGAEE